MFFKKVITFVVNLFHRSEDLAQQFVFPAVKIIDSLVNSPFAGLIENLIPGNLPKEIIEKAKQVLPKVIQSLSVATACKDLTDPNEIINCFLTNFGAYDPDGQRAIKHSLAALLSTHLSDQKISWSDAVHLAEAAWMELHGKLDITVDTSIPFATNQSQPADPSKDSHQAATIAKDESQQ